MSTKKSPGHKRKKNHPDVVKAKKQQTNYTSSIPDEIFTQKKTGKSGKKEENHKTKKQKRQQKKKEIPL